MPWLALYVATSRFRSPLTSVTWPLAYVHGVVTPSHGAVGRRAGEVVALLDGDDEERVVLRDPVVLQAGEEVAERLVVVLQLLDVAGLAGAVGDGGSLPEMPWKSCASEM